MKTFKQIKSLKVYERKFLLTREKEPAGIAADFILSQANIKLNEIMLSVDPNKSIKIA